MFGSSKVAVIVNFGAGFLILNLTVFVNTSVPNWATLTVYVYSPTGVDESTFCDTTKLAESFLNTTGFGRGDWFTPVSTLMNVALAGPNNETDSWLGVVAIGVVIVPNNEAGTLKFLALTVNSSTLLAFAFSKKSLVISYTPPTAVKPVSLLFSAATVESWVNLTSTSLPATEYWTKSISFTGFFILIVNSLETPPRVTLNL